MAQKVPRSILIIAFAVLVQTRVASTQSSNAFRLESTPGTTESLPENSTPMAGGSLNLFGNFGGNILDSFRGSNAYLHLTAIVTTYILVNGDVNYHVENFFNEHEEYGKLARPILFTGQLLPLAAGGGLFAFAEIRNDKQTLGASFAVLQASLIELLYNSTLKAITGRPAPIGDRTTTWTA